MAKRNPLVTALLGLVIPGLGHMYIGRARRFLVVLAIVHLAILALGFAGQLPTFIGSLGYVGLIFMLIPFSAIDSLWCALRVSDGVPRWYGRWYFYLAFIVLMFMLIGLHRVIREPLLGFNFYQVKQAPIPPVIHERDIILIDTRVYAAQGPVIGDVVLARRPEDGMVFIGRVTGRPSDRTFSYLLSSQGIEHKNVPLQALLGKATYVFYSRDADSTGKMIQ